MREVPGPRQRHVGSAHQAERQQIQHQIAQREQHRLRQYPQQMAGRVVGQHHARPMGVLAAQTFLGRNAAQRGLPVANDRGRGHHHPGAGEVGPPAQVGVLLVGGEVRWKAVDGLKEVGPHQHGGAVDGECVPNRIVLGLIQFACLGNRRRERELVDRPADIEQHLGLVPIDELGPNHTGIGTKSLGDERRNRVRFQIHVVVAEQVERSAVNHRRRTVGSGPKPTVGGQAHHVGLGVHGLHPALHRRLALVVQHQDRQVGVVLGLQRHQCGLEVLVRIVGHQHGHHRGRALARRGGTERGSALRCVLGVVVPGRDSETSTCAARRHRTARQGFRLIDRRDDSGHPSPRSTPTHQAMGGRIGSCRTSQASLSPTPNPHAGC